MNFLLFGILILINTLTFNVLKVSQKRADPLLVDRAVKELASKKLPGNLEEEVEIEQVEKPTVADDKVAAVNLSSKSTKPTSIVSPPTAATHRRQFRANRFLVQVIDENEALEESAGKSSEEERPLSPESAAYLASSPTTLISNTQSLDCETRASLQKEFKRHQGLSHQISDVGLRKTDIRDVHFGKTDELSKKSNTNKNDKQNDEMIKEMMDKRAFGLKRSSSGETTLKSDTMTILSQIGKASPINFWLS